MQLAAARIRDGFRVRHLFIMCLARIGLTQKADAFRPHMGNHDILVTVSFLLATVVQCLFFSALGALAATFRSIDDVVARSVLSFLVLGKLVRVSLWQNA